MEKKDYNNQEHSGPKPDKETLHTTDPQEHMKGPVSSTMKETGDAFDSNESKEEANEERDRKL
jgi:hypothetical protein